MMKLAKLIFINFLVSATVFIAWEFALRIFHNGINLQSTDRKIIKANMYGDSFGLIPNSKGKSFGIEVKADKYGFRKSSTDAIIDTNSILLIGDSVTFGVGIDADSTFAGKIANDLRAQGVGVMNFSLLGYNIDDYENIYKYADKNYEFQYSIIFYCLNDFGFADQIDNVKELGLIKKTLEFLRSNSYLYLWLKANLTDREKAYFEFDNAQYKDDAISKSIKNKFEAIKSIREKSDPIVIILPYEYQLRSAVPDLSAQNKLKTILDDVGLQYYDPYDFLRSSGIESNQLYLYADGLHFSKKGHKIIYNYLINNLDLFQ